MKENTEIVRHLLIVMGLYIDPETKIIRDQDTKSQISFEGKFIKANDDPNQALYISDQLHIKLDPTDPKYTKLLERMFGKFIDDNSSEEVANIPEVLTYFFDKDEEFGKYRLNVKFRDGTTWIGDWYNNKIICYLDAIFKIDGTFDIDLNPFDIIDEDCEDE